MPFIDLPGLQVHYETRGAGPAPVLLVHGNFASARWWLPVIERLAEDVTAHAPSARGCGQSARVTEGFTLSQLARDVADFASALGLDKLKVVGHSMGGAVAMQLAAELPDRVGALLLLAPPPPAAGEVLKDPSNPLTRILRAFNSDDAKDVLMVKALLAWGEAFGMRRRMLRRSLEEMLGQAHLQREVIDSLLDDASKVPEEALLGFLFALQHWDIRAQLGQVKVPTTVLWGDADPLVPREAVEAVAGNFPNGRLLVWPGVGHSPMYERPDELTRLVEAFARGQELPAQLS